MNRVKSLTPSHDSWERGVIEHQQNVLRTAAEFLTPAQQEALATIGAYDLTSEKLK